MLNKKNRALFVPPLDTRGLILGPWLIDYTVGTADLLSLIMKKMKKVWKRIFNVLIIVDKPANKPIYINNQYFLLGSKYQTCLEQLHLI